jgi:tetratricopeptide (TPR) repeat protein
MDRIAQLKIFIAQKPDDPFPQYALGIELKNAGDQPGAAAALEKLLELKSDYLAAYLHLGMLQQTLGRMDAARATFTRGQEVARKQNNQHAMSELTQALDSLS